MPLTAVEPCDEFGELKYGHLLGLLTCGHALQPLRHLKKDAPRPVLDVPSRTRLHCDPARGKTLRVEPETERTNAWKRSVRQNIYPFGSVHVFWRNSFRPNSLYGQPRTEEAMTRCDERWEMPQSRIHDRGNLSNYAITYAQIAPFRW